MKLRLPLAESSAISASMSEHHQGDLRTRSRLPFDFDPTLTIKCARPTADPSSILTQAALGVRGKQYAGKNYSVATVTLQPKRSPLTPDPGNAQPDAQPHTTRKAPSIMTDSGLAVLGHRLSQNKLPPLRKGLLTGLNAYLPDGFRIEGERHEPHDYMRAAAKYVYALAPAETKSMAMPWFNNMEASCRTLLGFVPARHFNDANPDVFEAIVSGTMRYFRHIKMCVVQSTDTLEAVQSFENENAKPSEYHPYPSRDCALPPGLLSKPTTRMAAKPTNGEVEDTSRPPSEVIVIGSSPDPRDKVSSDRHSPEQESDPSHDKLDGSRSPAHHEDKVASSDSPPGDGALPSASGRGAPSPVEEDEHLRRRLKKREKKLAKRRELRKKRNKQEKTQRREAGRQQQEASAPGDSIVNEQHAEEVTASEAEIDTSQNDANERYEGGQEVEHKEGIEAPNRLQKPEKGTRQDLQNAAEQVCTKTNAIDNTTKSRSTKVKRHEEVIFDISSDDDVQATRPAKKRKLDDGAQRPLELPRPPKLPSTVNSNGPRVAAHARAPKPTVPLPMLVNGRVTNPLHLDYQDPSSSSSSSDESGEDLPLLQTAESRQSAAPVQPQPLTLSATPNVRPLPTLEARANIDPASQAKTAKVFTVDVQEKLAQRRANRIKFLEQVLEEAGVDDDQLDQIEQRLKMKDSLKNAFDAVVKRRNWMRKR